MKKLAVVVIIFVIVIVGSLSWWSNMLLAVDPNNTTQIIFVIKKGDGVREIANNLKSKGLIKNPVAFFLLVKKLGIDKEIQAGDFRLSPSMTAEEIAQELTHGRLDIWITISEGKRAEEVAEILKIHIPSYKPFWKERLIEKEGYLFPDTYLIPKDADIGLVIALMQDNFEKKYASVKIDEDSSLSKHDRVIIASLVEREAKFPQDRPLVASVTINRLNIGMKLDIDATVQYALGFQKDQKSWWKKGLTNEDLKINSSYNTYINAGLPPKPIASPGLAALEATHKPAATEYLYYVSDKNGRNYYAKTFKEHQENIRRYRGN